MERRIQEPEQPISDDPRVTAHVVELFRKWHKLYEADDDSDDYVAASQEFERAIGVKPWNYNPLDVVDMPEPSGWMLTKDGNAGPHYTSWRHGRELFEALATAAGIKFTRSKHIAAHPEMADNR